MRTVKKCRVIYLVEVTELRGVKNEVGNPASVYSLDAWLYTYLLAYHVIIAIHNGFRLVCSFS